MMDNCQLLDRPCLLEVVDHNLGLLDASPGVVDHYLGLLDTLPAVVDHNPDLLDALRAVEVMDNNLNFLHILGEDTFRHIATF
jgi:hypothetical protein